VTDEAPYDAEGNLQHYPRIPIHQRHHGAGDTEWRPNTAFEATLTLASTARGRSAAYFIWADEQGHQYPMFMTDLSDLISGTTLDHGKVSGRWIVGKNYGLRLEAT
jgi:hypothetical protein